LNSDRAGSHAFNATLTGKCNTSGATRVPSDQVGARRFERIDALGQRYVGSRYYVFPGGCVTYHFDFAGPGRTSLANDVSVGLSLVSRKAVADQYRRQSGAQLRQLRSGAGA
jgi:uncharacterized ParB-like nuclease family protein